MRNEKIKFPSINGLRAISILLVIIHHLSIQEHLFQELEKLIWLKPFILFIQDGHLGVNVFFVISGFLITFLMLQEEKMQKTVSLKNFYIRRMLRIFPAYYFLLFVYFILQQCQYIYISDASWLTAITYTKYFNLQKDWITAHAWSLSAEELFYLFWPLMFVYVYQYKKKIAIGLILIAPILRLIQYSYPNSWVSWIMIFARLDSIATGCLFALYKDEIIEKIETHWKKVFYIPIIIILFIPILKEIMDELNLGYIFIPLGTTHGTIANFAIGLLMMYSIFGPRKMWFRFLNLKIINYIGLLSYSIYLWQQLFISGEDSWVTRYPQNLFFIFIIASSSYYFIEKPFLRLKTKFAILKT